MLWNGDVVIDLYVYDMLLYSLVSTIGGGILFFLLIMVIYYGLIIILFSSDGRIVLLGVVMFCWFV